MTDTGFITKCQFDDIAGQLNAGYRYFDMRTWYKGTEIGDVDSVLRLTFFRHGPTKTDSKIHSDHHHSMKDVQEQIFTFLDAHPTETVFLRIKRSVGGHHKDLKLF